MSARRSALAAHPFLAAAILVLLAGTAVAAEMPAPEHAETKELIALVEEAAGRVSAEGVDAACREFRRPDSQWLHDEVYVFIIAMDGQALCHPGRPVLEGRGLLDLKDPHGKPVVGSMVEEVREDGAGWVHYLWPRPGAGTNFFWKSSYVRGTELPDGRQVLVGSGLYQMPMERMFVVEQVEDAARLLEARGEAAFTTLRDRASGFRFYDSYVFVMEPDGIHRVNAAFPEHEGQNLLDLADEQGKVIGREILKVLEGAEAGWVDYRWPRPGDETTSAKSTYVRRVQLPDGHPLIVGAGLYTD